MFRIGYSSALIFLLSSLCIHSQARSPSTADDFRQEALVFERYETTIRMHGDGTGERVVHVRMRIQSQGAAQQFGVLSFNYASANETPHIAFVRVHKPDGTTVETPVGDAIDMPAAVTREAPLYSDLKEKHLPVRSLSVGDTLEYEVNTSIDKPEAPGQFWGTTHFTAPGTLVVLAEVLTLELPKDKYVQIWSPNHKPTTVDRDGVRSYSWTVAQLVPAPRNTSGSEATKVQPPKDPDEDADGRRLPSVAWTTFHSWAEVGDWYKSLSLSRAQPNDALRARAAEISKDAVSPENQIRMLFKFVSMKTRYVGIDFGVGRYQPHAATEVLVNQYGDCKDKDTLLEALLRAKGFSTAPALIGAGIAPVLDLPSPAVFNHVITTVNLPSGRIWLDSTPEVAPYQYLSAIIRDQKALVVPSDGTATMESTPAAAPYAFAQRFEASGILDADGKLTSKMTADYRDDEELIVRAMARGLASAEWDKASQYISSATGFGGTTSNTKFKNVEDTTLPISLTYDYARHPFGDWDNLRIVPLMPALVLPQMESDSSEPPADIELGAPRTLNAISRIRLPEGFRTDLPDPVHVKTNFATFDKTYRFEGKEIIVERTVVFLRKKLPKENWKQYQAFTKDIGLEGETWIQLMRPAKAVTASAEKPAPIFKKRAPVSEDSEVVTILAEPAEDVQPKQDQPVGPSTKALLESARGQMRAGDLNGANATLDQIKAKNPEEEFLWASYGYLAAMRRNEDEAKADYRKELARYPDSEGVVMALAEAENRSGDSMGARHTLQENFDRHPGDVRLSLYLVSLQMAAEEYASALKTLQTTAELNPEDRRLELKMSDALLHLNRKDEAAAAAKSVLDGAEDAGLLNDAAFALSQTGLDLSYAESASRKSIAKLEEKSATISTAEVNSKAFAESNLLVASWDTLGWILFCEGKYQEAKPLILAAWRDSLRAEIGDHLGQLYEAMKHNDDAAAAYRLADAAINKNVPPQVRTHIHDSFVRLEAAGAKPGPKNGTDALQSSRTYTVQRPAGVSGWGTFRLEITTSGVIESQQMSGERQIAGIKQNISKMVFAELLPPDSKAHFLRSAVVSCSQGTTCQVVLVPEGGLQTEQQ